MFDHPMPQSEAPQGLQRTRGDARVMLAGSGLRELRQAGSAKAFLPRVAGPVPEVVFLNTAGGLTGGDRVSFALDLGPGARASATTQAAERVYRSAGGVAEMTVTAEVADGAALAWLPQETILYDGAALRRRTVIRLKGEATCLLCEMIVLGRAAMGETVTRLDLSDCREIWRGSTPAFVEPLRLTDATLARLDSPAMWNGARAVATIALVARGAEDAVEAVRAVLPVSGPAEAAASGWDGKCVVRVLAPGARDLRRTVAAVLTVLGRGPLPRVWAMGGY